MQTSIQIPPSDGGCRPTQDEIAHTAYHLYIEQGSQHGHDVDDWLRAEQLLLQQLNESVVPAPAPPGKIETESFTGVRAPDRREHPFARDERGARDRDDVRRNTTSFRPASRQTRSGRENGSHSARVA